MVLPARFFDEVTAICDVPILAAASGDIFLFPL